MATSYELFKSPDPSSFYRDLNSTTTVDGFNPIRRAGERERHRVSVPVEDRARNLYYAIVAVDGAGNAGRASNVRQAYMPAPEEYNR